MNSFTISLKNELIKLKNTFAFWLTIISALFIPVIYFIYYLLKYESLIPKNGTNPWDKFITDQIMSAASLLLPMFIVLLTSLIVQIEHKSSGFKHIYSLPVAKWTVYYGKLSVVILSVSFTYLLFIIAIIISGCLVGFVHSELKLLSTMPNFEQPLKLIVRSFVGILGVLSFQFWLSFKQKNFIIPLGLGIILVITGLVIFQAEESIYFPYSYGRLSLFRLTEDTSFSWIPKTSVFSVFYFLIFSFLGYLNIRKSNIK